LQGCRNARADWLAVPLALRDDAAREKE